MTPHAFLNLLWQDKPKELYVLLWTLQDKRSHWFLDVGKAGEFAANVDGHDVYVGVGLSRADHGPSRRCTSEEIAGLSSLWTDLDLRSEAHAKPLPVSIPEALTILPPSMPPSIVIGTGNGIHPWWLLKEPHIFDTDEERRDSARLVARWHSLLRLNAAARGWTYDRLSDLARVLRIPGTLNHKDPAHPKEVTVLSFTDRRYNLSDFEEFLDEAGILDQEAQDSAAREWAERFADTPLAVDTNARISQDMLDAWIRDDMRFRNTWNRQRHDLKDQSQSGYDLALACFGVDAGLPEQRIVDLIVHHRSLFARSQRTRVDYFQRTIAKANQRTGGAGSREAGGFGAAGNAAESPTAGPAAPQGTPVAPEEPPAAKPTSPDPDRAKAMLCEQISRVLSIGVVRIVKITGKEPQYRMELAGGEKIDFPNVGKLISQESVRLAIAATVGRIIPKITKWDRLAQAMLDACIVERGTEEMEWEGAARMYIQHYLSETGFIQSIEGQRVQEQRRPMVIDGRITICASDIQVYVNKTMFQNLSVKAIAGMLAALGAKSMRVRGQKFKEQSRWVLPAEEFDPREYSGKGAPDNATE
jgi:hypothetical protein